MSEVGEDVLACYSKLAVGFKLTYIPHVEIKQLLGRKFCIELGQLSHPSVKTFDKIHGFVIINYGEDLIKDRTAKKGLQNKNSPEGTTPDPSFVTKSPALGAGN